MVNPNRYMNFNEICENVKHNMKTPFSFDMFTVPVEVSKVI